MINFRLSKTEKKINIEKYPDIPVLTYLGCGDAAKASKRFALNKKAIEMLNFKSEKRFVNIGRTDEEHGFQFAIANTEGLVNDNKKNLTSKNIFADSIFGINRKSAFPPTALFIFLTLHDCLLTALSSANGPSIMAPVICPRCPI